jgi:hypothetical protein
MGAAPGSAAVGVSGLGAPSRRSCGGGRMGETAACVMRADLGNQADTCTAPVSEIWPQFDCLSI